MSDEGSGPGKPQLISELVAVPPSATEGSAAGVPDPEVKFETGQLAEDAEAFRQAGWRFVAPDPAHSDSLKVYAGVDGRLGVVGNSLNVKFSPQLSSEQIGKVLTDNGLKVRRSMGFAKNLLMVEAPRASDDDPFERAHRLATHPDVEFAEPIVVEKLGSR